MNYTNSYFRMVLLLAILYLIIAGEMTGCTSKDVRSELPTSLSQKYSIIVVGNVNIEDKLWDDLILYFRRGLVQGLTAQKDFEVVNYPVSKKLAESSLILSGKITEVNKGSAALRGLVGFGAGKATVRGVFEICGSDGAKLVEFEAQESYAGGIGAGGADYYGMEDLMQRLGKTVAKKTVRRLRDLKR